MKEAWASGLGVGVSDGKGLAVGEGDRLGAWVGVAPSPFPQATAARKRRPIRAGTSSNLGDIIILNAEMPMRVPVVGNIVQ